MDTGGLSQKQLYFMATMYCFATMFLTLPRALTLLAQHTGWLCIILGMLLFSGYSYVLVTLMKEMKSMDFISFVHSLVGKWLGRFLTLFLLLIPTLFYSAYIMRLSAELFSTLVMPETPIEAMLFMFLLLRYWTVHGGIRSIGLFAEILTPGIAFIVTMMLLFSSQQIELTRITPLLDSSFTDVFSGSMTVLAVYMEIGILLFAASRIRNIKNTWKSLMAMNITVGVFFLATFWLCLGKFGAAYTKRLTFPTMEMVRNIKFLDYFEHLEIIFLAAWLMMSIVKGAMTYYAGCVGIQFWFGLKNYKSIMLPILIIIYYLSLIPQNLLQAVLRFEEFKSLIYPYYGLAAIVVLLGLVKLKKMRQKGSNGNQSNGQT
jgi:spore germination protein KB